MVSAGQIYLPGCVLTGMHPFDPDGRQSSTKTMDNIRRAQVDLETKPWAHISQEAKSLIRLLLTQDPKARPTATGALHHPWFDAIITKTNNGGTLDVALDSYQRRMQRKFRTSVVATVAATKLRNSLHDDDEDKDFVKIQILNEDVVDM